MKSYIEQRVNEVANYVVETKTSIRSVAKAFGVSKSTIHKDITERLSKINPDIAVMAKNVLEVNKSERHLRGGTSTRAKYRN